jgi:hypothetical protein
VWLIVPAPIRKFLSVDTGNIRTPVFNWKKPIFSEYGASGYQVNKPTGYQVTKLPGYQIPQVPATNLKEKHEDPILFTLHT